MPNSGIGTSSQTFNAGGNSNQFSQTNPYGPTRNSIQDLIHAIGARGFTAELNPADKINFTNAQQNLAQMPNFGPAAAQTASNFLQTGGDPTGILRREAANLNPLASMGGPTGAGLDPTQTPGMQRVLDTIKNDISNQVNGQFAGAGRSLSGLNTQTLARGISQGEAVPLLNQYNQNFSNMLGANQQLGNVQNSAATNIGQGLNYAQLAPQLAQQVPMMQEAITQQRHTLPYQYLANQENLLNPLAGLGGTVMGTQSSNQSGSGTATGSLLSQLGQGLGLLSPLGKFLGTF